MKLGRVALDGSKVKANASKHRSHELRKGWTRRRSGCGRKCRKLLSQAAAADKEEDQRYGGDRRGDELPEELQRRETRIARIQEAQRALEERARRASQGGRERMPRKRSPRRKRNTALPIRSPAFWKGADGFVRGYNTQIAVEPVFQLIVGQRVTQAANDKQQLVPLLERIEEQSGQKPKEVVADNGYCSDENLKYLNKRKIEGVVATGKQKHNERREPCKPGPLPKGASRVERMERKLATQGWGGGICDTKIHR